MVNSYDDSFNGMFDAFVAKLSPSIGGIDSLLFSTFLGGAGKDGAKDIAVDSDENVYVTGWTYCQDFPLVNGYDEEHSGFMDVFMSKLSPQIGGVESLTYSTFLGGADQDNSYGIAVNSDGYVYIVGETRSSDFPIVDPFDVYLDGDKDGFVSILSPSGDSLLCSGFFGGTQWDKIVDIAVDSDGDAYVTGETMSDNIPLVKPFDDTFDGDVIFNINDGFVTKISLVNIPPAVEITEPEEGFVYIADKKIIKRLFFPEPLIIGKKTVIVNAIDDQSGIAKVEFYVDDEYQEFVSSSPYAWTLKRGFSDKHKLVIKAIAYDCSGNIDSANITVYKLSLIHI